MPTITYVQNVINQFTAIGSDPRVSFYGNVTLGRDVSLAEQGPPLFEAHSLRG